MKKLTLLIAGLVAFCLGMRAQDAGLAFVQKQYPQLSAMFQKELISEHATYTFAIDVSGTMKKYEPIVTPALKAFVDALPNGDYVRIIRFGTTAKGSENGHLGVVSDKLKKDLHKAIDQLYTNSNDDKAFRAHTDVPAVMGTISSALFNSENKMNFVFILTDFRNDQVAGGEHKITSADLDKIYYELEPAATGKHGRVVALRLPVDTSKPGYCLDQLRDNIFSKIALEYEMQDITSDDALSSWFDELKKQIMVERLRSIVAEENKCAAIDFSTEIDIDGNVIANVSWQPNRLYASVKIDSSFVQDKRAANDTLPPAKRKEYSSNGFTFINNTEAFTETTQTQLSNIELGQIKHESWGFHGLNDDLALGVTLPTPYDEELHRLGIRKPIPDVAIPVEGLVFTFFLPFWLCATIIGLIILYIILVIRKASKNAKAYITKTIKVTDYVTSNEVYKGVAVKINSATGFTVPKMPGIQLTFFKKTSSPFRLFKRPVYIATINGAEACNARGQKIYPTVNGTFFIKKSGNIIYKVNLS